MPHRWKLIVTVHNSDIRLSPIQEPVIRTWQARLFARAKALTAVSNSLLEDASELYPNFRAKARVVHNGVGPHWFNLPLERDGKADYVLFAGRLHQVKGVDLLLEAWRMASPSFPGIELWIAGDGPDRESLEALATKLDLSAHVRFLGSRTAQELPVLYRNARLVVLPSRREGLPISLLEAGACGAICIGTRTPGIPEIIADGVTGFLIPLESSAALAAALSQALSLTPERLSEMRTAARQRIATEFSEDRMIRDYVRLYQEVIT